MTEQEQVAVDPELERLRKAHGHRYYISRTRTMWMATLRRDDNTERTIITDTADQLEARMANPLSGIRSMAPLPRGEL